MKNDARVLELLLLFLPAAVFRFLVLERGFSNDHFLHLASAQQMLFGQWPTRDFIDWGMPLMFGASALAQLVFGRTLLAEGLLVALGFALAAVLTAAVVRQLTGSRLLAAGAALLEVAIVPRAYSYPKVLLYAAWFYLLQRYIARPATGRLWALAITTVIAFLFRHDHGIYLAAAGGLAMLLVPAGRWLERVRRTAIFGGMVVALTAPYVVYVQVNLGIGPYLARGIEFLTRELDRQEFIWPSLLGPQFLENALVYAYWAIPAIALLVLMRWLRSRRADAMTTAALVTPIVAIAVVLNATWVRAPLPVRLRDVIVPAVILGAWLMACAWRSPRWWLWRPASTLAAILFAASVAVTGQLRDHLDRTGLLEDWTRLPDEIDEVGRALHDPHSPKQMPSRAAVALLPFYPYVERCTTSAHRLMITGFVPEALVFARRPFAADHSAYISGYYDSEEEQRVVVALLRQQPVPFVLIPGKGFGEDFDSGYPLIARYVRERYAPLTTLGDDPSVGVEILFDRTIDVKARDAETGWPCLK